MGVWKAILRALGLSNEARVRISAPGIDVTLTGDPEKVRALMPLVRAELEKNPRGLRGGRRHRRSPTQPMRARDSQVVRPTELDEMDSPYALPEAVVMPVPDEDVTAERMVRRQSSMTPVQPKPLEPDTLEPDTVLPRLPPRETTAPESASSAGPTEHAIPVAPRDHSGDEPESEETAIAPNPSGGVPVQSSSFVTDGGPTLMPRDSQHGLRGVRGAGREDS